MSLRARYSMLDARISCNTRAAYLFKLKHALRMAYRDGILESDLTFHFGSIRTDEVQHLYLTLDELNRLAASECVFPELKRAALFSALSGLRFSDIEKLVWGEVEQMDGDGHAAIVFRQKKTKNMQAMPLSEQALELLGPMGHSAQRVFDGLKYSTQVTRYLREWASYAQVSKPITFHCFRHTFATLQFNSGTDIYTVSKLLGHKELKTTQIYVRLMDSANWAAVNRFGSTCPGCLCQGRVNEFHDGAFGIAYTHGRMISCRLGSIAGLGSILSWVVYVPSLVRRSSSTFFFQPRVLSSVRRDSLPVPPAIGSFSTAAR